MGRIASEQGRWSHAIATFAYAQRHGDLSVDPALPSLIQYFLGNALAHEGYDDQAVQQLTAYLQLPPRFDRTTRMMRQLVLLSRQRGSTWETVGDALNRLDQPQSALSAYENVAESQPKLTSGLARRMIYTSLRLGHTDRASRIVLGYMKHAGADPESLGLVRYLAEQGVGREALSEVLLQVYKDDDQPASMVVAIVDLLDPDRGFEFLSSHLQSKPADRTAFAYFVKRWLGNSSAASDHPARVLAVTIDLITQIPSAAQEYASIVVNAATNPEALIAIIEAMPADRRALPVTRFIVAKLLTRLGRTDDALAQLQQAVSDAPDLAATRIDLAKLLIHRGQLPQAQELLAPLSDHTDPAVANLKLRILLKQGDPAKAMKYLDDLLARRPANAVDLVIEKANLQIIIGDVIQAHKTLMDALNAQPRQPRFYEQLIGIYRANRMADSGKLYKKLVERMLKTIPQSRVARTERARLLVTAGRYDQAQPLLQSLMKEDPDDMKLLDPMLTLLVNTDRKPEAQAMIRRRLEPAPTSRALLTIALQHYRRISDNPGIVDVSYRLMVRYMADTPRDLPSLDKLVETLIEAGEKDKPLQLIEQDLVDEPEDRGLLILARSYFDRVGNKQRMLEMTERVLLLSEPGATRSRTLAMLYLQHGNAEKAVTVLTEALDSPDPEQVVVLVRLLGQALSETGQPNLADKHFTESIDRFPPHAAEISFHWAMQCERRGDKPKGEQILADLLKDHPDYALANNALGYAWANRGENLEQAQKMIQAAVDTEPDNAAYLDSMGWVYYKLGRFNKAMTWLQRATAAPGGEYPVILDHLGDVLYRVGHHKLALTTWQQAQRGLKDLESVGDDPELHGLGDRLGGKIEAVQGKGKPDIADVPGIADGQGPQDGEDDAAAKVDAPPVPAVNDHEQQQANAPADEPVQQEHPAAHQEPPHPAVRVEPVK